MVSRGVGWAKRSVPTRLSIGGHVTLCPSYPTDERRGMSPIPHEGLSMNVSRLVNVLTGAAALAVVVALLGACSEDRPDALVASAKEYLAKKDYPAASIQLKNALKQKDSGEIRYLLGKTSIGLGDYAAAQIQLRQALESKYSTDAIYPELSKVMLGLGDLKKLVTEFGNVTVSSAEQQASIKADVGEAYLALGQPKEAQEAFLAALASVPGYPRARVGEGRNLAVAGDVTGATAIANDILAKQPDFPQALGLKADLLASQGKSEEAVAVLTTLVKVTPYNGQARFALVSLLIAGGKFDLAGVAIVEMKKALPRDIRGKYLEALLAFRQNDPAKARDALVPVLNAIPDPGPAMLLAGAVEYQLGSLSTAADHLRKVIAKFPNNVYARNILVATYLRQGQPGKAEDALTPTLTLAPNDPTVLRAAGEVALANNKLKDAAMYYDRALSLEKDNSAIKTRLAQIRLASGETERALADLETTSGLDTTQYQSDLSLITTYVTRKEYDKALAAVATLEKKLPADPLTYSIKGAVYLAKKDTKSARMYLEKALSLQANYLPAARVLAGLDIADKNTAAAIGRFESILVKEPNNEGALLGLAQAQVAASAPGKEITATFERAIKANPSSVAPRLAQINFLNQNRDPKAALTAAQAANAAIQNEPRILDVLGLAQLAAGETNQAIETFNKLASAQPDSPLPQLRLAAASYAAKQVDAPIQALRKALAIKPDLLEAQRGIIAMQIAAGKPEEALKEAKAVQKARPKEAIGFAMEGDVLESQKRHADAAKAYAEGIKRQPVPELVVRQIQLLEVAGLSAEARSVAAKWLKENPNDPVVRFHLATTAMQNKEFKEAVESYKDILKKQPDHFQTLNNLAWVLGELKDPSALSYAQRAYALAPTNAGVLDTYGWLLFNSGDGKRSVELLTQAAMSSPQDVDIRVHLAKALIKSGDKAGARKELEAATKLGEKSPPKAEIEQLLRSL